MVVKCKDIVSEGLVRGDRVLTRKGGSSRHVTNSRSCGTRDAKWTSTWRRPRTFGLVGNSIKNRPFYTRSKDRYLKTLSRVNIQLLSNEKKKDFVYNKKIKKECFQILYS